MSHYNLIAALGHCNKTYTGEYTFCCPFCVNRVHKPDTKFHLYVNPTKMKHGVRGWYHCKRCGARGPVSRLVKQESKISVTEWSEFRGRLSGSLIEPKQKKRVSLPRDYVPVIPGTQAHKYLLERGIFDDAINFYRIGFGTKDLMGLEPEERSKYAGSGRIIFPDFDDAGDCVYWVARTYKGHKIKYKNPAGSDSRDKIYNLSKALRYQTCVIAEGVISAIACGHNGVATYGKNVTAQQVDILVSAAFQHYFVAHDGDARREALDLSEKLFRKGCSVSMVCFDKHEDPASVPDIRNKISRSLSLSMKNKLRFKLGI